MLVAGPNPAPRLQKKEAIRMMDTVLNTPERGKRQSSAWEGRTRGCGRMRLDRSWGRE